MTPEKKITSFVDSYAVDLIHDIINQRFIPGKHFALSMGLETEVLNQSDTNSARTKARKVTASDVIESTSGIKINPRASPPIVSTTGKEFQNSSQIAVKYLTLLLLRKTCGINAYTIKNDETMPNFPGMYIVF